MVKNNKNIEIEIERNIDKEIEREADIITKILIDYIKYIDIRSGLFFENTKFGQSFYYDELLEKDDYIITKKCNFSVKKCFEKNNKKKSTKKNKTIIIKEDTMNFILKEYNIHILYTDKPKKLYYYSNLRGRERLVIDEEFTLLYIDEEYSRYTENSKSSYNRDAIECLLFCEKKYEYGAPFCPNCYRGTCVFIKEDEERFLEILYGLIKEDMIKLLSK